MGDDDWPAAFAGIIGCERCTLVHDRNLLRDAYENVPQPGWVGAAYATKRVLLIGQNPGTPKTLADADRPYTAALRALRDEPSRSEYEQLRAVLRDFIPTWPVHGSYFPLAECGLRLDEIAYFNLVRCRTMHDRAPNARLVEACSSHLRQWLVQLAPRVVVFIGKWAWERGRPAVEAAGIPCAYMNRQRSLASEARAANRQEVIRLVTSLATT